MKDLDKSSRRMGFKQSSAGPWENSLSKDLTAIDGVCKACGEYDVQLTKDGFCRDDECKTERLAEAFKRDEAVRLPNGTIVWMTDGTKIIK